MTAYLVAGPPCSGKSHHVSEHAKPGDLVIDWDLIARQLGSTREHLHHPRLRPAISAEYDRQLAGVADHRGDVWIIRCLGNPVEREAWRRRYDARLVLLVPDVATLLARAARREDPRHTVRTIRRWLSMAGVSDARTAVLTPGTCGAPATHADHIVPLSRWGGWTNGSTTAWKRVRAYVLNRDGHRCQLPVNAAGDYDLDADKVAASAPIPADPNDPTNLRAACARHNIQRGDGTGRRYTPRPTRWEW